MTIKYKRLLSFTFALSLIISCLELFPISKVSASIGFTETKLVATDGNLSKYQGTSTAINGNTIAVGAPADRDKGVYGGAVYVYIRNSNTWIKQAKLLANDGNAVDALGMSLSMDGNTIAAYAQQSDYSGAIYIFSRNGDTWHQETKIDPNSTYMNLFGYSLDINGDTLATAALGEGAIYVFTRNNGAWIQQARLSTNDALTNVSVNGDTITAGAPGANNKRGATYVFVRNGNSWTQQAKLILPSNYSNLSLGKSTDTRGDIIAAGSNRSDGTGAVNIFTRNGTSWTYQAEASSSDRVFGNNFGNSISLNYQEDMLLVGAPGTGSLGYNSGSAYLFQKNGTSWIEQQRFLASDGQADEFYGKSVSIWDNIAIVGTPESHNISGEKAGAVYVYDFQIPNRAPIANAGSDQAADEGQQVNLDGSASSDPDGLSDIASYSWDFGDGTTGFGSTLNHVYKDNGAYAATLTVTDAAGATSQDSLIVTVYNAIPIVNAGTSGNINEGSQFTGSGYFTDPGTIDTWTATVNYGDGTETLPLALSGKTFNLSHFYKDNGSYTITVTVTDNDGGIGTDTTIVTVDNIPPSVGVIIAPIDPQQAGTTINAGSNFTDTGVLDTHTAIWNWGDGSTSSGTVTENGGNGSIAGSHSYTTAGVYIVTLTVTDKDGGSGQNIFQYIVVYDPNGGFVTGAGSIDSPQGALSSNPTLSGMARFGFNSKYQNGANVPSGQTRFMFNVANFTFVSTSYEWLVVGGPKAQFKGSGTINGSGDYGFILTGNDGVINGGGGSDKFRIKVWNKAAGEVVYDNQRGDSDTASASTILNNGNVMIQN